MPVDIRPLVFGMIASVVIIIVSAALYAAVHSWLAGQRMKDWTRQSFGPTTDRWYRLAYNIVGGVTFLPLLVMLVSFALL